MRSQFRGYYPPSADEFAQLWATGIVVLDTNVLLNMYRYSVDTRESLFSVLEEFSDRLWLPHQVALEYHQSRMTTIIDQRKAYESLRKSVAANMATLRSELDKYRLHPVLEIDSLVSAIDSLENSLFETISSQESHHNEKASFTPQTDDVRDRLTALYEERVGVPYADERRAEIEAIGASRYDADIPPGYADKKKPRETKYGDLILWMQLIDHVERQQQPLIFVTDDVKPDWWLRVEGQTIGPRPELIAEMYNRTGQLLHMYRAEQFARYARDYSAAAISDSALSEIDHLAAKQEAERRIVEKAREVLRQREQSLSDRVENFRRRAERNHGELQSLRDIYQSIQDEIVGLHENVRDVDRVALENLEQKHIDLLAEQESLARIAERYADDAEHEAIQDRMSAIKAERLTIAEQLDRARHYLDALRARRRQLRMTKERLDHVQFAAERDTEQLARIEGELIEVRNLLLQGSGDERE